MACICCEMIDIESQQAPREESRRRGAGGGASSVSDISREIHDGHDDSADKYDKKKAWTMWRAVGAAVKRHWILSIVASLLGTIVYIQFADAQRWKRETETGFQELYALKATKNIQDNFFPVLIPCYGRPEYLADVLKGLTQAANLDKTAIVFSQDGDDARVSALISEFRNQNQHLSVIHLRHTPPFRGIVERVWKTDAPTAYNVYSLLSFAFDTLKADGAIVLESDIYPSHDFYDYFQWVASFIVKYRDFYDKTFTINGYHKNSKHSCKGHNVVTTDALGFEVWGWAMLAYRWPLVKSKWSWWHNWDITMERWIRRPNELVSVSPMVSRMKNLGMNGINFNVQTPEEADRFLKLFTTDDYSNQCHSGQRLNYDNLPIEVAKHPIPRQRNLWNKENNIQAGVYT